MKRLATATLVGLCLLQSGCYYGHLASGQVRLLCRRQPIDEVTRDESVPEATRSLLRIVGSVRAFARDLGLRVDGQYTSYVEWPGDRVVTTLVRTRPGSLEAVPWWFPFVGELPYRGYFDRERAETEAARLRDDEGFDVCVSAITAYSTLGWLNDPVTTPMLSRGAARLVETLLHEFVHSTAFVRDEADFNESVAQFIGEQAAILYFERVEPDVATTLPDAERVRAAIDDRRRIDAVVGEFRDRLIAIGDDAERLRADAERAVRERLAALDLRELPAEEIAREARLSDACLALHGTYVADAPRHEHVLEALGGDLPAMIARLERWAEEERPVEDFYRVD